MEVPPPNPHALGSGLMSEASWRAKELIKKALLPQEIDGAVIRKYVRKALRVGAWRTLKPERKALLKATLKWGKVRSETLKNILKETLLHIELHTLKGKALYYGVLITIKNAVKKVKTNLTQLLITGISYLNNPPLYRIYG